MKLFEETWCCLLCGILVTSVLCTDIQFAGEPNWSPYIDYGSEKKLECRTKQSDKDGVYMKWLKDGSLIKKATNKIFTNKNRTLTLAPLSAEDSGKYTCVAYDLYGNAINFTKYLTLRHSPDTVPPTVTRSDTSPVIVSPGESRNISCLLYQGDTSLEWKERAWFHNNTRLEDSDKYFTIPESVVIDGKHSTRLNLRINHITDADLGTYTCLGVNGLGSATRNITLDYGKKALPLLMIVGLASGGTGFMLIVAISSIVVIKYRRSKTYEDLPFGDDPEKYDFPRGPPLHDVFIAYSSKDQDWVRWELVEHLQQRGYDVFVDFKDFTPGERIMDNIMHGIYRSQRTLVLLSKNFLSSGFCEYELQAADTKRFLLKKDGLIVVKFDDCLVPEKFRKKTFLDWTDPKVKPHFWQRLVKAIGEPLPKGHDENIGDNEDKLNQEEKVEENNERTENDTDANREEVFEGENNNLEWRQNMNRVAPVIRRQGVNSTTSDDRQLIDNDYLGYNYEPDINANQEINNHNVLIPIIV